MSTHDGMKNITYICDIHIRLDKSKASHLTAMGDQE
jgi:hypothetical protein